MFVSEDFVVPRQYNNDRFRMRMLTAADTHKDYEAVMETQIRLREHSAHGWPREGFTLEENTDDLRRHEREFFDREAFAYTVITPDESRVLGCIYINPGTTEHDAVVRFWVRESERDFEDCLLATLQAWMAEAWPFTNVRYETTLSD